MTGNNHDRFSLFGTPLFIFAASQCLSQWPLIIATAGYTLGWVFLSPDLDLPRSNPLRRWGALKWIWIPYEKTHDHRGLSHWPIVGSMGRSLYLGLPIFALLWLRNPNILAQWPELMPMLLFLYAGIEAAC